LCIQERPAESDGFSSQAQSLEHVRPTPDTTIDVDLHLVEEVGTPVTDFLEDLDGRF
jgi:hypothetical protein